MEKLHNAHLYSIYPEDVYKCMNDKIILFLGAKSTNLKVEGSDVY